MPEERDYIRRAAAALETIMKKPFEPDVNNRRLKGKGTRRKMKAVKKNKQPEKPREEQHAPEIHRTAPG